MSEEDLRGWLGVVSSQLRELDKKTEVLRVEIQAKSSEAHARLHSRINDIQDTVNSIMNNIAKMESAFATAEEVHKLEKRVSKLEPIADAVKRHMETDVPVEAARDKAIARGALYILGLSVSGFIGWLFSRLGGK